MSDITKKFASLVEKTQKKMIDSGFLMPERTDRGVRIGGALIVSKANIKDVFYKDSLVFENVSLNKVAIALANGLAQNKSWWDMKSLYDADQDYGKWFIDCQVLMNSHRTALKNHDYDKADVFFARYNESRTKAMNAKKNIESLLLR